MTEVYQWCLIIGGVLLAISALGSCLDGLDGAFDGVLSVFHINIDFVFLPLSGITLTGGTALFGAVGLATNNLVISLISAYIFAVILNIGAKKLKKESSVSANIDELFLHTGTLVSPIVNGSGGCVMFQLSNGSRVKYACKLKDSENRVEAGTEVSLIDFDSNNTAIVKLAKELEIKYGNMEN